VRWVAGCMFMYYEKFRRLNNNNNNNNNTFSRYDGGMKRTSVKMARRRCRMSQTRSQDTAGANTLTLYYNNIIVLHYNTIFCRVQYYYYNSLGGGGGGRRHFARAESLAAPPRRWAWCRADGEPGHVLTPDRAAHPQGRGHRAAARLLNNAVGYARSNGGHRWRPPRTTTRHYNNPH